MIGIDLAGRYRIESVIGSGGMGTVYLGLDKRSGSTVAIKHLKPEMVQDDMLERFRREGEALRELDHPNIVKMLDAIEDANNHYLIMEYISGNDLSVLLKTQQLSLDTVLRLSIDLADALTRAHKLNIIHRDLKPANVLIGDDNILRLTDFGVAHVGSKERVTDTNALVGTVDYLPPEAFEDSPFDERGDIWAFGVMLFEMLTGNRPFTGESIIAVVQSIATKPIPDLEALRPDIPPALIDLIYRMLDKDPLQRVPSVRIIGAELEAILRGGISSDIQTPAINYEVGRFESTGRDSKIIPNNLPADLTTFVGREAELKQISDLIHAPDTRLITILAPGGMGKTRLSIKAASQALNLFPDGVYFVDLAPLSEGEQILSRLAEVLGIQFTQSSLDQLKNYLRERVLLLIMDNFEHLVKHAGIITELLSHAPSLQVIASSRIKLNLSGETVLQLGGMEFPDWETPEDALEYSAVQLFLQSAKRVQPGYELTAEDLPYIARICRLVQGLPLGVILAASWLDSLNIAEIAEEITASTDMLETEQQDVPERQRSIRAVFEYSLRLLPDDLKLMFYKASIFRGGFTREAAKTVTGASIRQLNTLSNHSLIQRDVQTGRYTLHELMRQYAEEGLRETGIYADVALEHARYYAELLRDLQNSSKLQAGLASNFVSIMTREWSNIRAAWFWFVDHIHDDYKDDLENMLFPIHGYGMQTARIHTRTELIEYAFNTIGVEIENAQHNFDRYLFVYDIFPLTPEKAELAYNRAQRALPIFRANDDEVQYFVEITLGFLELLGANGDVLSLIECLKRLLDYYEHASSYSLKVPPKGDTLRWLAFTHMFMGKYDDTLYYARQAQALISGYHRVHALDAFLYEMYLHVASGYITGDFAPALDNIQTIIRLAEEDNDQVRRKPASLYLATIKLMENRTGEARAICQEVEQSARANYDLHNLQETQLRWIELALIQGDVEKAQKEMAQFRWEMTGEDTFSEQGFVRSLVALTAGDYDAALAGIALSIHGDMRRVLFPSLTAPARFVEKFGEAAYFGRATLHIIAAICAGKGDYERAAELLGKISVRPYDNVHWAEALPIFTGVPAQLRKQLGDVAYTQAFEHGKSLDLISFVPDFLAL